MDKRGGRIRSIHSNPATSINPRCSRRKGEGGKTKKKEKKKSSCSLVGGGRTILQRSYQNLGVLKELNMLDSEGEYHPGLGVGLLEAEPKGKKPRGQAYVLHDRRRGIERELPILLG